MEKGLNRNSMDKVRKSFKKGHGHKASLDDALLRHFGIYQSPSSKNIRSSFQSSVIRNTFNYNKQKNENQGQKQKITKVKKPALKDLINRNTRYSAGNFTCSTTPKQSKCGSILNLDNSNSQISKYKFIYQIGFGGFGKVWKVMKKKTYKQFAMKQISKFKVVEKDNVQSILNQRLILSTINHPFLINMHSSFQDSNNLYLTMDYLKGADLRYHICYKEHFNEAQIKFIVACILIGLEYVHENNIIHRDIKPQNIVFQETGYARITDFGIAKLQTTNNLPAKFQSSGTPGYMAPQILCKMPYSFQSDFFALGVMIYELILGHRPYQGKNRQQIRENMLRHQASISQYQLPKGFNKSVIDFINQLLQRNPQQRLGFNGVKQIKNHKWLKDIKWKAMQKKQIIPPFKPNVICETKQYLQQIVLYNQMKTNQQNFETLSPSDQKRFQDYDFRKGQKQSIKVKKPHKQSSMQNSLTKSKSKPFMKTITSQNYSGLILKPSSLNTMATSMLLKRNKRNSQQKIVMK